MPQAPERLPQELDRLMNVSLKLKPRVVRGCYWLLAHSSRRHVRNAYRNSLSKGQG
jgi:hypothetical protein